MEIAALGLRIDGADGIERARDALGGFTKASEGAGRSTEKLGKGGRKAAEGISEADSAAAKASKSLAAMYTDAMRTAKGLVGLFALRQLQQFVDGWSDMQSVVGASIGDMSRAAGMMTRLVDIANASYSPLQQTVDVYSRNVSVLRDLGKSSDEAAAFTESLNHMLVLTATRGERATSVQNALAKAMAVGKLDAQGLETVLANGGEVAQALAKELGTTVNGLRAMATEGKITGKVIAEGVIKPLDDVRERAADMPATIGDAFTRIQTNVTEFVGKFDKASGVSAELASVIIKIADGIRVAGGYMASFGQLVAPLFSGLGGVLGTVADHAGIAVAALAGFYAPALIGGISTLTVALNVGLVGAIKAVTAAMMANPIGFIVGALAAALYAAWQFSEGFRRFIVDDVGKYVKASVNLIIGSFTAASTDIKFVFMNLSNIIGSAMVGVVNVVVKALNDMIRAAVSGIDGLISLINQIPGLEKIGSLGDAWAIPEVPDPYGGKLAAAVKERNEQIKKDMSRDYVGEWFSGSADGSPSPDAGGGPGGGILPKTPKGSASELANLVKQLQLQHATLGMTAEQAARYEIEMAKGSETDRKRALTLYDQIQAWNETEKAMQAAIDSSRQYLAFQQEMDVFQQKLNLESAGVGMGDRQRELAQADLAIRQEYAQKRLDLEMAQQVKETALTQEQYQYRLDLFQQFEEQKLAGLQQSAEARAIAEADWTNGMSRAWENFATKAQDIASQTDALFTGMLDSMTRGFGNAFESMIFDSENLGDAMQKLGQNMLRSVVNALGQMAAQWLAYQAVQLFVGKTTQASSAMAISANAYATALQAGLAAFASTAAIPVVGPAAAPAAMGAALAVATPLATAISMTAMAGMAHDGIDSVPQTGTWLLEKGERVTTAKTSARLDSVLERIDARQRAGRAFDGQPGSSSKSEPRVVVQLMGGEFQGAQVTEERGSTDEEMIVRVMSREFLQGGQSFDALQSVSNVRRVGA